MKTILSMTLLSAFICSFLAACDNNDSTDDDDNGNNKNYTPTLVTSDKTRITSPQINTIAVGEQVDNNTRFALDVFQFARTQDSFQSKNIVFSPFSISQALAMLSAGAMNNTLAEIQTGMRFNTTPEELHSNFNYLDLELGKHNGTYIDKDGDSAEIILDIVNSSWGQKDFTFNAPFLDTLVQHYGAGMYVYDFINQPAQARLDINDWLSQQTRQKITDAIPEGVIDTNTRLVLTNSIYMKANWNQKFSVNSTFDANFNLLSGATVSTKMMNRDADFGFYQSNKLTAVELDFVGEKLSFVAIMPDAGEYNSFESNITLEQMQSVIAVMTKTRINLQFPKFNFDVTLPLKAALQSLGITELFIPSTADLSAISAVDLFVQDALHSAYFAAEESGIEAAAVTVIVSGVTSVPPTITFDRSFVFLVRDKSNNSLLFFGRVLDPTKN